jgi:hypothetical protein
LASTAKRNAHQVMAQKVFCAVDMVAAMQQGRHQVMQIVAVMLVGVAKHAHSHKKFRPKTTLPSVTQLVTIQVSVCSNLMVDLYVFVQAHGKGMIVPKQ